MSNLCVAVDAGVVINPLTASGQVEGGMTQALGYAHCEEIALDVAGDVLTRQLDTYHIYRADEMPELEVFCTPMVVREAKGRRRSHSISRDATRSGGNVPGTVD